MLAFSGEEIIDLLKGGQGVLNIVAIAPVMAELETAIRPVLDKADSEATATAL